MRLTALFLVLCALSCFFFLRDSSFLSSDYLSEDITVGYNYAKSEPITVPLMSYPLDEYIGDNQLYIASFSDSVYDVLYDLERLSSRLSNSASDFIDFMSGADLVVGGDPLSSAYLYSNDRSYRSFIDSYLDTLRGYYRRADMTVIQKYILPRFINFIPNLSRVLVESTSYYSEVSGVPFSLDTWKGSDYFIIDPYYYFQFFGVSPVWHISIQDNFSRWGIPCLYIDTSFQIQGAYRIYQYYYSRSLDSENNLIVELVRSVPTDYFYDVESKTIIER